MQSTSIPSIDRFVKASQNNNSQELEVLASEMLALGDKNNPYTNILSTISSLYSGFESALANHGVTHPSEQAESTLRQVGIQAAEYSPVAGDRVLIAIHETAYKGPR